MSVYVIASGDGTPYGELSQRGNLEIIIPAPAEAKKKC
jgi:hypothetical protein